MNIQIPEEIFGIKKWECEVVSNYNVATFIKEFIVRLPEGESLDFQAGGYIQIDVPAFKTDFKDFNIAPHPEDPAGPDKFKEDWRLGCQVKVKQDMNIQIPEEIFGIKKWECEVVSNYNVATFIKEFIVRLPEGESLDFQAGGYIHNGLVPSCVCSLIPLLFSSRREYRCPPP